MPSTESNYESGSLGQQIIKHTTYGADFDSVAFPQQVVETIIRRQGPGGSSFIKGNLMHYDSYGNVAGISNLKMDTPIIGFHHFKMANLPYGLAPSTDTSIGSFEPDVHYEREVSFKRDSSIGGVLKEKELSDGTTETYVWGYSKKHKIYPVAKIIGSNYNTAVSYINQSLLDSAAFYNDSIVRVELNKLRINLPNAFVTTYTYAPLIGITSETNPNGEVTYYKYDGFGRLSLVLDENNNILKRICYNYAGLPEDCKVYYNQELRDTFTRANCAPGYTGGSYTYIVHSGKFAGLTQAEADTLAQADLNTNGQKWADSLGTCTLSSPTIYARLEVVDEYYHYNYDPAPNCAEDVNSTGTFVLRFYADYDCLTPLTLTDSIHFICDGYLIDYDQDETIYSEGYTFFGENHVVPPGQNTYTIGTSQIYFQNLLKDCSYPFDVTYAYLQSGIFYIRYSEKFIQVPPLLGQGGSHPRYYFK